MPGVLNLATALHHTAMSKTLVFSATAAKAFEKLSSELQERIYGALFRYGSHGGGDVKRMAGSSTLRMRVGDYRVIFDERPDCLEILIVGHRRDVYH